MRFIITSIFCLLTIVGSLSSQVLSSQTISEVNNGEYDVFLDGKINNYKIVKLDYKDYLEDASKMQYFSSFELEIDESESWDMQLLPQHHLVENLKVYTPSLGYLDKPLSVYPYAGYLLGNSETEVRLTFGEDFIYGFWQGQGSSNRFIEPLFNVIPGVDSDLYIVYNGDDVVFSDEEFCASSQLKSKTKGMQNAQKMTSVGLCYEVDVSTASDFLMYTKYGSNITTLTNHNVGVMNNVQMNYDDEFADELQFQLNEQWISDCSTCDPWSSTLDAGDLLFSFRNWANGNPSGFDEIHDVGQLWTDRNIESNGNSGTVGIAYVGVVCGSFRYQVLEDFTSNANFLRVMVAHELGHNFDAVSSSGTGHDPSGSSWIMAPSVSNVSQWSPASISDIEGYYNGINCMAACAPPVPPVAAFSASLTDICPGTTIQFFDESTASPTSWLWVFPGGTPGTSTDESPIVTYNTPGVYSVTLTATNGIGSDMVTVPGFIDVSFSGTDVVLADDFSSGLTNWNVTNPDNQITWESTSVPGSSGESTVAWINNYDYNNGVGDLDGLESTVLDFSGRTDVNLELEYAYARYNGANSDIFRIKISTNGGVTFPTTLFTGQENGSGSFATVPDQLQAFVPTNSTEWCIESTYSSGCIELDLSAYNGESNVVILLENESDYGNNLYLDNILITSSCQVLNPPMVVFTSDINEGCVPLTVQFEDLSGNNPDSWNWSFPGGTPSSSNQQNPLVVYNQKGLYDVSLIASNAAGSASDTYQEYIDVNDVPVASFTSSTTDNTVFFTNNSVGGLAFAWDFGDNENSTDENPIHVYDEDGSYIVTLTVFNDCGSVQSTEIITIATLPNANFDVTLSSGCASLTVQYINQSSSNTDSYLWTFEGGIPSTSTEENPLVIYNNSGVFDVTLVVENEQGFDTLTQESYIEVFDVPDPDFSAFENGYTVDFTNETPGDNTYLWEFGDTNTSTDENPSHTYVADGVYAVTLTATNDCGDSAVTGEVVVANLPTAGLTASGTTGCIPFTVQFSDASSSNVDSWNWFFEGGSPVTSTEQNPVVVYNSAGTFDVSLTVVNEQGSDQIVFVDYIVVGEGPTAGFDFSANQLQYNFTNTSTNSTSYFWEFGDGETSNLENPTHTYLEDGTYTVRLTTTNDCGSDVVETIVQVVSEVQAGMGANVTSGCAELEVQFTDNSTANVTNWFWTFEGGSPTSSTEQNPIVTYESAGTYDVVLEVSNSAFTNVLTQMSFISVQDIPTAGFDFSANQLQYNFTNTSTNSTSYFWEFGDGETSNLENPTHTYLEDGTYTVRLTTTNDCGSDVVETIVQVVSEVQAGMGANVTSGCAELEVQFTDNSTANVTNWFWTFEGGSPTSSTEQNPIVTYESAGTYDVVLEVSNSTFTDVLTQNSLISVQDVPDADFSFDVTNLEVIFQNLTTNGVSYNWDFGDNSTSNLINPNHIYDAEGTYEVILISTNNCGSDTSTIQLNVSSLPTANFTASDTEGCTIFTVVFEDLSTSSTDSWFWEFEGGNPATSTEQNPIVVYENTGIYDVKLTASNDVGSDEFYLQDYIEVGALPNATISKEIIGVNGSFSFSSSNYDISLWTVEGFTGSFDTESIDVVFPADGDYEIKLTLTNECGTVSFFENVTITAYPDAAFSSDSDFVCAPAEIQFNDLSEDDVDTWLWTFEGGNPAFSSEQNPVVSYINSGTYAVELIVNNNFGSDTIQIADAAIVNEEAVANFEFSVSQNSAEFTNSSNIGGDVFWDFGDMASSSEENPTHVYSDPGEYLVTMIIDGGSNCVDTISQLVQILTVGIEESMEFSCKVYPVPARSQFFVEIVTNISDEMLLGITNTLGQQIDSRLVTLQKGMNTYHFDNQYPSGLYLITLSSKYESYLLKLIID